LLRRLLPSRSLSRRKYQGWSEAWRGRVVAAVLTLAATGSLVAVLLVLLAPGAASAKATSSVQPLVAAAVPPVFKNGIAASARRVGASPSDLVEVAAEGDSSARGARRGTQRLG
jgi:hypothetical protein